MKFLVTGGAGFIGSNIVEELLKRNYAVRALDNFSTGKKENLNGFLKDIELVEGDIRNYDAVIKATQNVDAVLHQAALPSVPRSIIDPITTNDVNVGGTLNILNAARENGVEKVVYVSSSSVYGDTPELPKHEGMIPNPLSPYAVTKLTGEKYCDVFAKLYGLKTISLRYFNVFGPRQDPSSQYSAVIPKFIKAMLNDEQPTIYGGGEQTRDFTYIANVVDANILAATKEYESGLAVNCACHDEISLNQLVDELNKLLGKQIKPKYVDPRPGDIKHSFAAIEKIKTVLGFNPSVSFKDGLQKTVAWYSKL